MITYESEIIPEESQVKILYNDNQWTVYTDDMVSLMEAIKQSFALITAWDDDKLVGLIRAVGDGVSILYIQDLLVLRDYQRKGIGRKLITMMFDNYKDVKQKVLLTDDTEKTQAFYQSVGMKDCEEMKLLSFVKFK